VAAQTSFLTELGPGVERDLRGIPAAEQRKSLTEIQLRLKTEPYREIKTRIKRLTGIVPPLYRLRVGDYRAYYRIVGDRVVVFAVLNKKIVNGGSGVFELRRGAEHEYHQAVLGVLACVNYLLNWSRHPRFLTPR
jgi:mRNA-degrading endonuclease RelE of RelBE toxin-antitoxin system